MFFPCLLFCLQCFTFFIVVDICVALGLFTSPQCVVRYVCGGITVFAGSGCGIMLLNWPGSSTIQWGMGRGLLCLAALVVYIL